MSPGGRSSQPTGLLQEQGDGALGSALPVKLFMSRAYSVGAEFSDQATALDQNPWILLPPFNQPTLQKQGRGRSTSRSTRRSPRTRTTRKTLGVFGTLGVSDQAQSIQPFFIMAWAASLLRGRDNDTFGIAYSFNGVSADFKTAVEPIRLRNESAGELYYNFAVTSWSLVTADLQFVDPFAVGSRTRTFFSIRWKLIF